MRKLFVYVSLVLTVFVSITLAQDPGHPMLMQEHQGIQQEILTNRQEAQTQFTATNSNVDEQSAHLQLQSGIDQNRQLSEAQFAQMSQQLDRQDKAVQGNLNIESARESTRRQLSENNHNSNMNEQHQMLDRNVVDNRENARQGFQQTQSLQSISEQRQAAKQSSEHGITMAGISENRGATQQQFQTTWAQDGEREQRTTARQMEAEKIHSDDMRMQHDGITRDVNRNNIESRTSFGQTNDHISRNYADTQGYRRNDRVINRLRDQDQIARLTALSRENEIARSRLRDLANRNHVDTQYDVRRIVPQLRPDIVRMGRRDHHHFHEGYGLTRRLHRREVSESRRNRRDDLIRNLSRRQRSLTRKEFEKKAEKEHYDSIINHFKKAAAQRRRVAISQRKSIARLRKFIRNLARRQRTLARKIERRQELSARHKRLEDLQRRSERRLHRGFARRRQSPAVHSYKNMFSLKNFVRKAQGRAARGLAKSFSGKFKRLAKIVKRYKDY